MIRDFMRACAFGAAALLTASGPSAAFGLPVPKKLPVPEISSAMTFDRFTLAPFQFVRFCVQNATECQVREGSRDGSFEFRNWQQLARVNAIVNSAIRPQTDGASDGVSDGANNAAGDTWSLAPQSGDCEDYALTKRSQLLRLGWSSGDLLLATATVPGRGGHAVLVVRTQFGDYVLDNLREEIMPWEKAGYSWSRIQSPENPMYWKTLRPEGQRDADV